MLALAGKSDRQPVVSDLAAIPPAGGGRLAERRFRGRGGALDAGPGTSGSRAAAGQSVSLTALRLNGFSGWIGKSMTRSPFSTRLRRCLHILMLKPARWSPAMIRP